MGEPRTVCWFSAGAASAVATKLTLQDGPAVIVYTDTGSEHDDNPRFIRDCETWFGQEIVVLRSDKYRDTWSVWEDRRFLVSPHGAPCTLELKKKLRLVYEHPTDRQVFGYTADPKDAARAERFADQNPGVDAVFPLIERGLTKGDCLTLIDRAGIRIPRMYELGFSNNNCVGCCKAASFSYWNRIRRHFPDTFDRMAVLERDLGYSVNKDASGPVWLDELDPQRADDGPDEPDWDCSLFCAATDLA